MAVSFRDTDPRPKPQPKKETIRIVVRAPAKKVTVSCDRCSWTKAVLPDKAVPSIRGHYGYAHPERRLPEQAEARALIT
jgi:hypothetical protein